MASPGAPIARIVNLNKVQVEAEIPESFIAAFKKGDKVDVHFASLGITRSATIKAISQVINPGNRTFKIEVDLPNSDGALKPNLLATLKLKEYESADKIVIPTKLIQDGNKGNFIYVVESDTVQKKWLTVGESYDGESEIIEGLGGDEVIINLGFRDVLEGEPVKITTAL
jgi:RND family efflux transporter MFP subunit